MRSDTPDSVPPGVNLDDVREGDSELIVVQDQGTDTDEPAGSEHWSDEERESVERNAALGNTEPTVEGM